MARKTNGSAVRSKKTVPAPAESVSPVPAAAQVSTELSANVPVAKTPVAVTPATATPVTVTPAVATPVAATPVTVTRAAPNGNKPSVTISSTTPSVTKLNGNGSNLDEEIRRRAYELFLQRNGKGGDPNRDWLAAENEVKARHAVAGR